MTLKPTMRNYEPDLERLPILATPSAETLDDPAELFLHLTSWLVPYGGEARYYGQLLTDLGYQQDSAGNWWLEIACPRGDRPTTCFMAHLDTCDWEAEPVTRFIEGSTCKTDGKTILGADDRAGVTLLLYLSSHDVPGLYYLFIGEERGCQGSGRAAGCELIPAHVTRAISFDRKGKTSVITHQCGRRTCSDTFALALCNALNEYGLQFEPDNSGVYTDSNEFVHQISECTNLSVGYHGQHTNSERQDLEFLSYLSKVCVEVDWEALPTERRVDDDAWDWEDRDDDGHSYYYGKYGDWSKEAGKYGYTGSKSYGIYDSGTAFNNAYDAVEELYDNADLGLPADEEAIARMLSCSKEDREQIVALLLDDLRRWVFLDRERTE